MNPGWMKQIFKSIILFVSIAHAGNLQIDSVLVRDHPKLLPHVGMRIFESVKGSPVDENVSEAAFKIWSQTPFLSNASHVSLARYRSSKIAAVISMDPVFNSHVSGMVGTGKNPSGFWESQGEINLHLENVWATAGALDVSWNRLNAGSQFTEISVSEPYLPVVPIGLHAGWKEHLQDAMSLLRATEFSALLHSQHGWTWKTGYRKTTIRPTDAAQKEGFESSLSETAVLGLSKITVDHPWLPKSGFKFDAFAEFGVEERTVSASSIASAKVEAAYFYPVSDRWIWMTGLKSSGTFSGSGSILPAQQVRFGGMQSLRGYSEDFFRSDWVVIPTIEMRFAALKFLQFSGFIESAFQSSNIKNPMSWGFGLTQQTEAAVIQVFYGLARGKVPADGTIHIKLTGLL